MKKRSNSKKFGKVSKARRASRAPRLGVRELDDRTKWILTLVIAILIVVSLMYVQLNIDGNRVTGVGKSVKGTDAAAFESTSLIDDAPSQQLSPGVTDSTDDGGASRTSDPVCGNRIVESGEQCDDGNTLDEDGCSSICQFEAVCGNDVIELGEECEPSLTPLEHCVYGDEIIGSAVCNVDTCTFGACTDRCGDSVVGPTEQCDDGCFGGEFANICEGEVENGDGCSNTCQTEVVISPGDLCGNGVLDAGELCDPALDDFVDDCSVNHPTLGAQAQVPGIFICETCSDGVQCEVTCGNGVFDNQAEQCDDGNLNYNDGCSGICKVESGFVCTGWPSQCGAPGFLCGDGTVQTGIGEQCEVGVGGHTSETCEECFAIGTPENIDDDADGVVDNDDSCPGTNGVLYNLNNGLVDVFGCSRDQVDADGDGACNSNGVEGSIFCEYLGDSCPGTAVGDQINSNGCGQLQTDPDQDGICTGRFVVETWCPTADLINDNCPNTANADQTDDDLDGIGNLCDPDFLACADVDGDGVCDGQECTDANDNGVCDGQECTDADNNGECDNQESGSGSGGGGSSGSGLSPGGQRILSINNGKEWDRGYARLALAAGGSSGGSGSLPSRAEFVKRGEVHHIDLTEVGPGEIPDYVVVIVSSEPQTVRLDKDQPKEVDLDGYESDDANFNPEIAAAYYGKTPEGYYDIAVVVLPDGGSASTGESSEDYFASVVNDDSNNVGATEIDADVLQSPSGSGSVIFVIIAIALAIALAYAIVNYYIKRRRKNAYLNGNHPYLAEASSVDAAQ